MDSIVSEIIQQYQIRAEFGEKKYGVTLDREDLSTLDWIEHAKQEAMDLTLYLEKLKKVLGNQARYYDATGKFEASHETKDRIIYNLNRVIMSQEDEIKGLKSEIDELKKEDHTKKKRGWHF
jgi:predicted RNase H-like nuclease (RuvC/YqgF family)